MAKNKMPPELLAHFKKKQGEKGDAPENKKEDDKMRRKEAVNKARIRLEEKSRRSNHDKEKEAGKERAEKP